MRLAESATNAVRLTGHARLRGRDHNRILSMGGRFLIARADGLILCTE
jgi:hypothetical protein